MDWAWQLEHGNQKPLPGKSHYQHQRDLDSEVKDEVSIGVQKNQGKPPRVLVMGALGRCGSGVSRHCGIIDEDTNLTTPRLFSAVDKLVSPRSKS